MSKRAITLLLFALTGTMIFNYGASAPAAKQAANQASLSQGSSSRSSAERSAASVCGLDENLACDADCHGYCPSDDLAATISSYFGTPEPRQRSSSRSRRGEAAGGDPLGVPSGVGSKLHFLIAIVPDPVHTHLSLFFDQSVEAIEMAVDSDGYIFARAETPWDNQPRPETLSPSALQSYDEYQQAKESLPGLMIFRRRNEEGISQSLFIFLVAEVPTNGINKTQFHHALRAIHLIASTNGAVRGGRVKALRAIHAVASKDIQTPTALPLQVIGPTFSGSLYSLDEIFAQDGEAKTFEPVEIFSGTVTSGRTVAWFLQRHNPKQLGFTALRRCDGTTMGQLKTYVREYLGYGPSQIAVVSEDETAYGENPSEPQDADDDTDVLRLQFPRDIASLRAAYEQALREQRLSQGTGRRPPRTGLPLTLEDTGSDDDSIATYSHSQKPVSEQESLLSIASELRAHKIRVVVLRATSILDRLFVAEYLRSAYPQGRIVISGADRLFQGDVQGSPSRGVLALTDVPLWTGEAAHEGGADLSGSGELARDHLFSSDNAANAYYATLDALDWQQVGKSGGPKYSPKPFWLTVAGRDGYWPVAKLGGKPSDFRISPTISWTFLFFIGMVLVAIYVFHTWRGSIRANAAGMVAFAPVKNARRSWVLCVFGWLLLGTLLMIVLPSVFFTRGPNSRRLWEVAGWIAVGSLLASCFLDLRRREARSGKRETRTCYWFISVSVVLVVFFLFLPELTGQVNIFLYRYTHVSSGVSPLLPMLLLLGGGLWWAWYSLKGLVMLDARRPRLPEESELPVQSNPSFKMLSEPGNLRLLGLAKPLTLNFWVYLPPLAAAVIVFLLEPERLGVRLIEGLEGTRFDFIYEVALGLILFALTATLLQLVLTWFECRSLLRSLDRFPLRRAFKELKEFSWHPIWHLSAGGLNDLNTLFNRELECVSHLRNTATLASLSPELADLVGAAKQHSDKVLRDISKEIGDDGPPASGTWLERGALLLRSIWTGKYRDETKLIGEVKDLRICLASVCGAALSFLATVWQNERGLVLLEKPSEEPSDGKTQASDPVRTEIQMIEQFVCLLYGNFIFTILRQIRTLLTIVAGLFVFAVLSLSSYPFVPGATIRSVMLLLFLGLAAVAATVYAQMHGDATLGRITDSSPGKLGGDFWLRMGSAVGLPLIGLLAYQFPQVNNLLFFWLQPALQALK